MDIRIKELSYPAARLLLTYLLIDGANDWPVRKVMEVAGFQNKNHFYTARKLLQDLGYIQQLDRVTAYAVTRPISSALTFNSLRSLKVDSSPEMNDSIYLSSEGVRRLVERDEDSTATVPSTAVVPPSTATVLPSTYAVPSSTTQVPDSTYTVPISTSAVPLSTAVVPVASTAVVPDSTATVLSLYDRCLDADAMDATGPESQRNSPFQKRRAVQIGLVKEAWEQFFPKAGPLTDVNAKRFLAWCENRAELVHDELEALSTRQIASPITYVSRVLEKKANERKYQPPAPPQPISSAKPNSQYNRGDKGEPIGADELLPVTPEQLQQMKELSKEYAKLFPSDY